MYLSGIQATNIYNVQPAKVKTSAGVSTSYSQSPIARPSFTSYNPINVVKTQLTTKDEVKKYCDISANVDKDTKVALDYALKSGILLNNKSNDKSTALDNLYKMMTTKRADGLDTKTMLSDTIKTIANPCIITQHFGNIPENLKATIMDYDPTAEEVTHSGCCVAASIEYNLASQMPAEFVRVAEGISSEKMSVNKTLDLKNLCENKDDAKWLLDNFKIPYVMKDNNKADVTIAPDKNAIIRAHIQTVDKDALERSPLDVLMQSTFMNVGSQQTYNTLNDTRVASFGPGDKGLVEIEKTFTESVVTDSNKTSITFQDLQESVDNEGNLVPKLVGYKTDFNTVKRSLLNSMASGQNVIIGYTSTDADNNIINGHEITVIGAKVAPDGKLIFVCNDTDDDLAEPIEYHEDYIIPRIHHVGLPTEVVDNDSKLKAIS